MSHSTKNIMTNVDMENGAAYTAVARNSEKSESDMNNTSSKTGISSKKLMLFIAVQALLGLLLGAWVYNSMVEGNSFGLNTLFTTLPSKKKSSTKRKIGFSMSMSKKDSEDSDEEDSDEEDSEDEDKETFTSTTTTRKKKAKRARKAPPPPPPAAAPAPVMAMPSISINNANGNSNAGGNTVN